MPNPAGSLPPGEMPNVPPQDMAGAAHTRIIVEAVKETVAELKTDVKDIKGHRVSDTRWHLSIFGGGFIILAGMLITGYFKLNDRIENVETGLTRVETQLDDLLQRIPPVPTPIPHK